MILTDKAVFRFAEDSKLATLASIHPGYTVDDIVSETGFIHDYVPPHVPETPVPSTEELQLLREDIDPHAAMLPR